MKLIRFYITTIFLLVTGVALHAQMGEQRYNMSVGINGGVNYANVSFDRHRIQQKGLLGPNIGLTARYISEKYFAMICGIQVELNYSQRGWDKRFEDSEGNVDNTVGYTRKMNYIEVPLLAHLAFGRDVGVQFFINLGPQIGYMIGDSESHFGLSDEALQSEEYGKPIANRFDYGIAGGAGLEVRTRKAGNFLIEGRYFFGLADFYNSAKKDYFSRSAHNVITVKLTYLFDITK